MRSFFAAFVVLGLSIALLSRSVSAGPPMAPESRDLSAVIASLRLDPALKGSLAAARFYGEVFGGKSVNVYGFSPSGHNALAFSESQISQRSCGPLTAPELKAASALLKEYGDALPVTLRAYTLGLEGKAQQSSDLFAGYLDSLALPPGPCPGEHRDSSHGRVRAMNFAMQCLRTMTPKREVSKQEGAIQRAVQCAGLNTTVG